MPKIKTTTASKFEEALIERGVAVHDPAINKIGLTIADAIEQYLLDNGQGRNDESCV